MGAPDYVANKKIHYYSLIILIAPSSTRNLEKFFLGIPQIQKELHYLDPLFSKIFRENSIKLRKDFFSNELVQYLWSHFLFDQSAQVKEYIKQLKSSKPYQGQVEVLLSDVLQLSQALNYQILKPEHLY